MVASQVTRQRGSPHKAGYCWPDATWNDELQMIAMDKPQSPTWMERSSSPAADVERLPFLSQCIQ